MYITSHGSLATPQARFVIMRLYWVSIISMYYASFVVYRRMSTKIWWGEKLFGEIESTKCMILYGRKKVMEQVIGLKFTIIAHAENCAGCHICQLRCSDRFEHAFNPSKAKIQIRRLIGQAAEFANSFTEECDACGLCARYCPYGALILEERR